jgi:hypothetical protein
MDAFLSTFVFILPGIMAYFWLQVFGLNPTVKHTAPELTGISALLWVPVSFITLFLLNIWSTSNKVELLRVDKVRTVDDLNKATADLNYILMFLIVSLVVSYFICWAWCLWGNEYLRASINKVRVSRGIAPLSSSASVWEEFFIKIHKEDEEQDKEKEKKGKEAVLIVYKIDKPEKYIIGSMTKASRPHEIDKSLVLEKTEEWKDAIKNNFDYDTKRTYVDIKSGMVVKEIDHKKLTKKPFLID